MKSFYVKISIFWVLNAMNRFSPKLSLIYQISETDLSHHRGIQLLLSHLPHLHGLLRWSPNLHPAHLMVHLGYHLVGWLGP